jgi:flagellar biosynthetic protein FliR
MVEAALTMWTMMVLPAAARVAGMMLVAPVFGQAAVPVRLRILMALVMGVAVAGRAGAAAPPANWLAMAGLLAGEVAVGAVIGYAASLVFAGVDIAAAHISAQMGISLGQMFSPSAETAGGVRALMGILAIVFFLAINGHRELIAAVLGTFDTVPVGGLRPGEGVLNGIVAMLTVSFVLGLKVAAPVLVAMLLATVALGMLQRTLPQCHILSTGLPARALLGLLVLALSVASMAWAVEWAWSLTGRTLTDVVKSLV